MYRDLTLSIDAMGGDNAPEMVVEGLDLALSRLPGARLLLFGDERRLEPLIDRAPAVAAAAEIRHTRHVVRNDDRPSVALRAGRDSSMRRALDAVARGEAGGAVSAGNTGALMAIAKFVLKTLPGIDRPAIATLFPNQRGASVILDLGANVECDADNLVQFAVMGEVFARTVQGIAEPSIGILNVGEEDFKGHEAVKKAAAILQDSTLAIRFHGFVEGDDIGAGTVDVIVTDGFTGNVALKTAEGTARLYSHILKEAFASSWVARTGALLAGGALRAMRRRVDPRHYNGAMFLGLNGVCVKSHGGTDAVGFANAVKVAADLTVNRLNDGIKADYACISDELPVGAKVATA